MKRGESAEIDLGTVSSMNELRRALQRESSAVHRAEDMLERNEHPFGLMLEWIGPNRSPLEISKVLEVLLASLEPEPSWLRSIGARWVRDQNPPRVVLTLGPQQPDRDPAGVLLVEHALKKVAISTNVRIVTEDIRKTLTDHVMARPDSEYAIAIDIPIQPDHGPRFALTQGLEMERTVIAALPAKTPNQPDLREIHVWLSDRDGDMRLRIWRLGLMKISGQSRMA